MEQQFCETMASRYFNVLQHLRCTAGTYLTREVSHVSYRKKSIGRIKRRGGWAEFEGLGRV